jgi:hypothetical protein
VELYLHSPNTPSWRGTQLKHRDYFTCATDMGKVRSHRIGRADGTSESGTLQGFLAANADCTSVASTRACELAGIVTVHRLPYEKVLFKNTATRGYPLTVMAARSHDSDPHVQQIEVYGT